MPEGEAREAGRDKARERRVEHLIQDGTISEKHSHGDDPRTIAG